MNFPQLNDITKEMTTKLAKSGWWDGVIKGVMAAFDKMDGAIKLPPLADVLEPKHSWKE